tara:strand:+ start:208 stop:579 length:372 start_codon:yes stop_codon:yes gene_type:complete
MAEPKARPDHDKPDINPTGQRRQFTLGVRAKGDHSFRTLAEQKELLAMSFDQRMKELNDAARDFNSIADLMIGFLQVESDMAWFEKQYTTPNINVFKGAMDAYVESLYAAAERVRDVKAKHFA